MKNRQFMGWIEYAKNIDPALPLGTETDLFLSVLPAIWLFAPVPWP